MPHNEPRRPRAGDAVRLTAQWPAETEAPEGQGAQDLPTGEIGVLQGLAGHILPAGLCVVTFNHRTFRGRDLPQGPERVASTGLYAPRVRVADLRSTDETTTLTVWRWRDGVAGPGNAEEYTVTVPVWDWEPVNP